MKIIFHEDFYNSDYIDDGASVAGRMESIIEVISKESNYELIKPEQASYQDLLLAHSPDLIKDVSQNTELYKMALLSTGAAIKAAQIACINQTACFACNRPPGHHAYRNMRWDYCYFSNLAISLLYLKNKNLIKSAFVLDFDAHTGDGTIDVLSSWKECRILNPMAEDSSKYMKLLEHELKNLDYVDIIAVSAGFDSYIKDLGRKLTTFDYYSIGFQLKKLCKRFEHNRRFAILEGGYYLPDLGKNVLAFCQGFE